MLIDDLGCRLTDEAQIVNEILTFYKGFLGTDTLTSKYVDLQTVHQGPIMNLDKKESFDCTYY